MTLTSQNHRPQGPSCADYGRTHQSRCTHFLQPYAISDLPLSVPLTKGKEHASQGKAHGQSVKSWREVSGVRTKVGLEIRMSSVTQKTELPRTGAVVTTDT